MYNIMTQHVGFAQLEANSLHYSNWWEDQWEQMSKSLVMTMQHMHQTLTYLSSPATIEENCSDNILGINK